MRISEVMVAHSLVTQLQRATARLFRRQEQVSSGYAFTRPSEDPPGAVQAAALRSGLAELARYEANCGRAASPLKMTEVALADIGDRLREARDAALAMSSVDEGENAALADRVHELIERIVADANETLEGRYLFGGYQVLRPPLIVNAGGPPDYLYDGDRGDMQIQLSRTTTVTTNLDAAEMLNLGGAVDPARADALETLRGIEAGLRGGDREAIEAGLTAVEWHLDRVLAIRAEVGARTQQVELARQRLADGQLTLGALLSEVQDVDVAEALIGLRSQEVAYQAAAAAASSVQRASLLDYI